MKKYVSLYVYLLFYLIALNVSVASATLIFHEAGHFYTGEFLGCKNIKIVLFDSSPFNTYTEMNCPPSVLISLLELGGLLLTIPLSLFFLLFLDGFPEKHFFWIILGFNILISLEDLKYFSQATLFIIPFALLGSLLVIVGENLLIDKIITFFKSKIGRYQ